MDIGTIPSKTFREGALYLTGFMQRGIYGPDYTLKEDVTMADLVNRCEQVAGREAGIVPSAATQEPRGGPDRARIVPR